ncbi:hypothetical protein ACFQY7_39275 [Actinomadura luteofluorescens]|uniref:Branched-chain amino acid ATP-binding cassette transporter C-terminal domain-containing protein n=1 Tax=Actinomadura luteofluorescens TaxID=46163 RepID=A0A7Y9EJI3_9ACTN|nr:hypothetical protein [Actinomadura luteofluorescens]NYD48350.1 hypothetical protein [Actinomadura luteofluorescens]
MIVAIARDGLSLAVREGEIGRCALERPASELAGDPRVVEAYLGGAG